MIDWDRVSRRQRAALCAGTALVGLAGLIGTLPAWADSGNPACANTNGSNCQVSLTANPAGHGQTGPTPPPDPITYDFTDQQTLTAGNGAGAIDFTTVAGDGGAANHDGMNGGTGGTGGAIGTSQAPVSIGSAVTVGGANGAGILRFLSQGGRGGGGQGAHTGTRGTGGTGGAGGGLYVDMEGGLTSSDAGSIGLMATSQGGSGGSGDAGSTGFFGAHAGIGGSGGTVGVIVGGSIDMAGKGIQASSYGGTGGQGPNDNSGFNSASGSNGGNGGAGGAATVTVTGAGAVTSSQADGVDVAASGGAGGNGGNGSAAPVTGGGTGGAGGAGGAATGTVDGTVQGAVTGMFVLSAGGAGGAGGTASAGVATGGNGGLGGAGGATTGTVNGSLTGGSTGLTVASTGGAGGNAGTASGSSDSGAAGGNGGNGGQGGSATATIASTGTVTSGQLGVLATAAGGNAGGGAQAGAGSAMGGNGGIGGSGGSASVIIDGKVAGTAGSAVTGVQAIADGGTGGAGAGAGGGGATGGNGGNGGQGGTASVTIASGGSVTTTGADAPRSTSEVDPGIYVSANGGIGGAGGSASAPLGARGGGAGFGGAGNAAIAVIDGSVTTSGSFAHGVLAQGIGGQGGNGGDAASLFWAHGGAAKNGGHACAPDAADCSVAVSGTGGTITTTGTGAAAIVGQSIGGGGGSGGNALSVDSGVNIAIGGNGGAGGNGGTVSIGSNEGDANAGVLDDTLITRGADAAAIVAQSVGGAGGNGGNALAAGGSVLTLSIGGDGKGGGNGGAVTVTNDGVITTFGLQSGGIAAQSVGGGGGNGGSGVSVSGNVMTAAVAIGGTGAGGGPGGTVTLTNNDQVTTYGADAYGMKAQSISGGGGEGGTATAVALAASPDPEVPAVSVAVGIGGTGGAGGDQSNSPVAITNDGFLSTAGDGAIGLFAQNIAGGGGNGGDSTASSYSAGAGDGISISLGVAGPGGAGGTGGPATATNNALVLTLGESAHGVMVQSIGGGGGTGGIGDSQASNLPSDFSASTSISVGGQGGTGSVGGTVQVNNNGSIATRGDGARAIYAHSVGGGGGASGGGVAKANAQDLSLGVTLGGNAGSGGNGGTVAVTNTASLLTRGSDADAIHAQSVGGGGGSAGKGSSTAGGAQDPVAAASDLATSLANGLGLDQNVTTLTDGVFKVGDGALEGIDQLTQLETILPGDDDSLGLTDDDDDGEASSIELSATIGGQGGAGGSGNTVTVDNSGSIATTGARSDGIFAQNLGGGGGVGGASSFSGTHGDASGQLRVGASGAGGGDACIDSDCNVTVTNEAGGLIRTGGVTANGITAQSIGGGGGKGGVTASASGALKDLTLTLGGSGGRGGAGGPVTVDVYGTIDTTGRHAYGILAQSTGGGGGIAHALSSDRKTDATDPGDIGLAVAIGGQGGAGGDGGAVTVNVGQSAVSHVGTKGTGAIGLVAQSIGGGGGLVVATSADTDDSNLAGLSSATVIPVTIGSSNGTSGNGGSVTVTLDPTDANHTTGNLQTTGSDAYGVLAQSVGGGGGLVVGGSNPQDALGKLFAAGSQTGNGGAVSVTVNNGFSMGTAGAGAVGVLAQSIGGGGGVIGGLSGVDLTQAIRATPVAQSGQGGNVTVDLESGGNIVTSGPGAHVIVAQSLGGGGGILSQPDGSGYAFAGSSPYPDCSGSGCTGAVTVTLGGNTVVRPLGEGAYGVVVQSQGNGVNDTTINVDGGFIESWAKSAGAIFIAGAGTNTVNNSGTIDDGSDNSLPGRPTPNATGVSITGNQPATINNNSGGTINGSIVLPNGTSALNNNGGTYHPGSTVDLGRDGVLTNAGTVSVGGTGRIRSTVLVADYVQTSAGHLLVDTDHVAGTADRLEVSGDVDLAGTITVRPHALIPATVTVLSAGGALDLGGGFGATRSHLFTFTPSLGPDGQSVQVTPSADFHVDDDRLSSGQQSLAAHLARLWEGERPESFATGFARLANEARITDGTSYGQALNELSGQSVSAIGASRHQAGQRFVAAMNSCPVFEGDGTRQRERDCGWVRTSGAGSDRKAGRDQLGFIERTVLLQAGGQREIADGWFLGGSLAYENSTLDARQGAGSAHGDGVLAGLLVKRQLGNWVVSGTLAGGYGWYDSKRHLDLGGIRETAAASPETQQLGLSTRIAYQLPFEGWYLEPYLDLDATYLRTGSYTETGAGALDLSVDSADDVKFAASPMLELGGRVLLQEGVTLRPYASLGAVFYDDNDWHADTRFAGAPASAGTFQARTELPDTLGRLNLGLELQAAGQIQVRLEYAGELGEDYQGHSGTLRLNYLF